MKVPKQAILFVFPLLTSKGSPYMLRICLSELVNQSFESFKAIFKIKFDQYQPT